MSVTKARTFATVFIVSFLAMGNGIAACDPLPDECEESDNVCDGNVANRCEGSGDTRLRTIRTDCGTDRVCVLDADNRPLCARAEDAFCPKAGESSCKSDGSGLLQSCFATSDGHLLWVDSACSDGWKCVNDVCEAP